jgi:hypothetical protein
MTNRTAFISGALDPSESYFADYYASRLDQAIADGDDFVVGPMPGVDRLALDYLLSHGVDPERITVFMTEFESKGLQHRKSYEDLGICVHIGGITTRQRDALMTEASDYDILRYRTEAECKELYGKMWRPRVSNTEMNERRRNGVYHERYIVHVTETTDLETTAQSSAKNFMTNLFNVTKS